MRGPLRFGPAGAPVWMDWLRDRGALIPTAVVESAGQCGLVFDRPRRQRHRNRPCRSGRCPWRCTAAMGGSATLCARWYYAVKWFEKTGQWEAIPLRPFWARDDNVRSGPCPCLPRAETPAFGCGLTAPTPWQEPQVRMSNENIQRIHLSPDHYPARGFDGQRGRPFNGASARRRGARAVFARATAL